MARLCKRAPSQSPMQLQENGAASFVDRDCVGPVGAATAAAPCGKTSTCVTAQQAQPTLQVTGFRKKATAGAVGTNADVAGVGLFIVTDQFSSEQQPHELQAESEQAHDEPPAGSVFVCLADTPSGLPWRPLAQRADVLARRGLQRISGARLAKAVRDLRELEGMYIVKDHDRCVAAEPRFCT